MVILVKKWHRKTHVFLFAYLSCFLEWNYGAKLRKLVNYAKEIQQIYDEKSLKKQTYYA